MSTARRSVAVTVDLAVLAIRDAALHILLIERGKPPFRGEWALPGGHLEDGEDLDSAAARELIEETGLDLDGAHLEQLRTYGTPERDPRGRVVTVAYIAFTPDPAALMAGDDARSAEWAPVAPILDGGRALAFDHAEIVVDAVERARTRLEYTTLATRFCPQEFTIADLRQVYEVIWGAELDQRNFWRKITGTSGAVIPTGEQVARGGRPAALYRRGPATTLHPPILQPGSTGE